MRRGDFVFRYTEHDDFGEPENAFLVCSFWYVNALAALNRREEARELFERLLKCRNSHGLLAEHIDPHSGEQWGNFAQTYSIGRADQCCGSAIEPLGSGILIAEHIGMLVTEGISVQRRYCDRR